jgi:hypothetical protein
VSNKPPRLLLSFNLFLTYPDARLPLMHSTYLNHCMIFDTTKEAVNRQKTEDRCTSKEMKKIVEVKNKHGNVDEFPDFANLFFFLA